MSEPVPVAEISKEVAERLGRIPACTPEEDARWNWNNTVREHFEATGMSARFFYKVKEWDSKQKKVFDQTKELLQRTGAIVALIGPRGLGKTTIASQLIIERAQDETLEPWVRRPPYRKAQEIVARFKSLYADYGNIDTERLIERFKNYAAFPLLIIDEFHECDDQRMKDRVMTDLLDRRYAARNDTVLISNQTAEQFVQTTNESTLSRLEEHGRIIKCNWQSFRRKAA
jgi:DNA replication protein DnaC